MLRIRASYRRRMHQDWPNLQSSDCILDAETVVNRTMPRNIVSMVVPGLQ